MPPHSTHIDDEGLLVTNFHLVKRGVLQSKALRALLASGPHPPRAPATNEADVRAQIAANERGIAELRRLCNRHSLPQVRRYMRHVQVSSVMQSSALRVPLSPCMVSPLPLCGWGVFGRESLSPPVGSGVFKERGSGPLFPL